MTDTRAHVLKSVRDLRPGDEILSWEDGTPFGPWIVQELVKRPLTDEYDIYLDRETSWKVPGGDVRKVKS